MKKLVLIIIVASAIVAGSILVGGVLSQDDKSSAPNNQATTNISRQDTPANNSFTLEQIAKHNSREDCWIVIRDDVYDVSEFLSEHPGGAEQIAPYCGKDATEAFNTRGGEGPHSAAAQSLKQTYLIGTLSN